MHVTRHGWKIFDAATPLLTFEYSFGPGTASALACGCQGGLVVVSPPCNVTSGVFEDLSEYGNVRALVASNAFHYLGIPEWKERFPDAEIFAPAQSIARIAKRTKLQCIRPIAEAACIAGSDVELVDMPHYKTGEVLVRMSTPRGLVWYVTDVIMNLPSLPSNPVVKFVFWATRSGPGLKINNIAPLFMVADKTALRRWLAEELRRAPPDWLIPAHGAIVDVTAMPSALHDLLEPV